MKLSDFSINELMKIINGALIVNEKEIVATTNNPTKQNEREFTGYKSGSDLVNFFNNYGFRDIYSSGLPDNMGRKGYTISRLTQINGQKQMENLVNDLVFSRNYLNTSFNVDEVATVVNKLLQYDGYGLAKPNNEYIVVGKDLLKEEAVEVKLAFEDIQSMIITEIQKAKFMIWVAVAWFTDAVLFSELLKKSQEGLNIRLIICDDKNNKLDYGSYFETHKVRPFGAFDNNMFHRKYCVVDLETVIEGSYNWTNKAQFNDESITILSNRDIAEKFAKEFIATINKEISHG